MSSSCIIVAADFPSLEPALALAGKIGSQVAAFKVGNQLASAANSRPAVAALFAAGSPVFRDGKWVDIPNTVAGTVEAEIQAGLVMFNVMCLGGKAMMAAAKETSVKKTEELGIEPPLALGVTILTSLGYDELVEMGEIRHFDYPGSFTPEKIAEVNAEAVRSKVVLLAELAKEAGLDGVIASAQEAREIRKACGPDFKIVTPGIRLPGAEVHDQKRVMTPGDAVAAGVDYLVVGRDITKAEDPAAVVKLYNDAVTEALASSQLAS